MTRRAKQSIGLFIGIGFLLQLVCVSFAQVSGNCPILISSQEKKSEASELPPCHHNTSSEKQTSDSSDQKENCCSKDAQVSVSELSQSLDWQKLGIQKVLVDWFIPSENPTVFSLSNKEFGFLLAFLPSSPQEQSVLQVFLI